MALGETYSWENQNIDDNFLRQYASGDLSVLSLMGETHLGSQQQSNAYELNNKIQAAMDAKYQAAAQQLAAKGIDLADYVDPTYQLYDAGEGASANRNAPLAQAQLKAKAQMDAIRTAEAGNPPPNYKAKLEQMYSQADALAKRAFRSPEYRLQADRIKSLIDGNGTLNPEGMAKANAAAARVGAPLPYPNANIGSIAGGGAIDNSNVGTAYKNGQLSVIGQQVLNSNTMLNKKAMGGNGQGVDGSIPGQGVDGVAVAGNGANAGSNGGAMGTTAPGGYNLQAGLDILKNSGLDAGAQALFSEALRGWNPEQEINVKNVLDTFNKVKSETIDPYFAEQANIFMDQIKSTEAYTNQARQMELEGEKVTADQNIRGTQNDLEARGMTFSGQAVDQLGNASTYGTQQGQPPQSWQIGNAPEGKVNQANRLMSSSSAARYQKGLQDLQRNVETTLGTAKAQEVMPGVAPIGNVSGALNQQKNAQYANTVSDLFGQAQINYDQNKQINLFK